jgi:hypothetical protein
MSTIIKVASTVIRCDNVPCNKATIAEPLLSGNRQVLVSTRATRQGQRPDGYGPLFAAFAYPTPPNGFDIAVHDIGSNAFPNIDVTVDWVIIEP